MSVTDPLATCRAAKPRLVALAEAVSLAVRVEPELLRRARLDLVPEADASVEADLWFSRLVDTQSATAFMFVPEVADRLRRDLARDPSRLERAWTITSDVHANVAPAIVLEEEVNYLLLAEGATSSKLQDRLKQAVVALVAGGEDRAGVARWAVRALSRLPASVAETEAGQMLTVAARSRLGRPDVLPEGVSPDVEWLPWVLPREAEHVRIGVQLYSDGLEIGKPDEARGHVIPLPNTNPLVLHVSWREGIEEHRREVHIRPDRPTLIRVRPAAVAEEAAVLGVAVSAVDGRTDWTEIAEAGARFGFAEATGREAWFRAEWPKMRALPVRGAYHVGTLASGAEQADRLLATVDPGPHDLLALDIEQSSDQLPITPREIGAFVERVHERTGRWPGLAYSNFSHAIVDETGPMTRNCWLWARGRLVGPPRGWREYAFVDASDVPPLRDPLATYRFNSDLSALFELAGVEDGRGVAPTFTLQTAWGEVYTIHPRAVPAPIAILARAGGRSAFVAWRPSGRIDGCVGFALYRRKLDGSPEVVSHPYEVDARGGATPLPTTRAPVRDFTWLDGGLATGDVVQYRAVPVIGSADTLQENESAASESSDPVSITTEPGLAVTFNRGVLGLGGLAARIGDEFDEALPLRQMIETVGSEAREYLGGDLRSELMAFLAGVSDRGGTLYAALHELSDPEALMRLSELGPRAHVLLPELQGRHKAAELLRRRKGEVRGAVPTRGGLFHHRFAVACASSGEPEQVWIGGANWTPVALCVQANGATIVSDRNVAALFLERWRALASRERRVLDQPSTPVAVGSARVTVWFTPVQRRIDLDDVERRLDAAREGILFATAFASRQSVLGREVARRRSSLYRRGVMTEPGRSGIRLFADTRADVVDPKSLLASVPRWSKELGRFNEFLARIVAIDPFGERSTVLSGSHGLTPTGSEKNDETLLVVENAPTFAAAHAVRIMALYRHYAARAAAARGRGRTVELAPYDAWQERWIDEHHQHELAFWLGSPRSISAASARSPSSNP